MSRASRALRERKKIMLRYASLRWIFFLSFAIRLLRPQGQQKIVIVTLLRTEWRRT
jgi:hypothetical protein